MINDDKAKHVGYMYSIKKQPIAASPSKRYAHIRIICLLYLFICLAAECLVGRPHLDHRRPGRVRTIDTRSKGSRTDELSCACVIRTIQFLRQVPTSTTMERPSCHKGKRNIKSKATRPRKMFLKDIFFFIFRHNSRFFPF